MDSKRTDTYYDVLRVDRKATIAEIVAAYHSAKAAFSKDSVATYSLFSSEETEQVLSRLEEAYMTLSNIDKKRDYDKMLARQADQQDGDSPEETMTMQNQTIENFQNASRIVPESTPQDLTEPNIPLENGKVTGTFLKEIREKRSLSLEDVSRITKIPVKFLKALEDNDKKGMPARVYLQGFVKNLANLYKMDPQQTVKAYLSSLDADAAPAAQLIPTPKDS